MTVLIIRESKNDYSLWPVTALKAPKNGLGTAGIYLSLAPSFSLLGEQVLGLEGRRFTALQFPVAAYICYLCMWGFVPELNRERPSPFCTHEIIVTQPRALCSGQFFPCSIRDSLIWGQGLRQSECTRRAHGASLLPYSPTWVPTSEPMEVFLVQLWYQSRLTVPKAELASPTSTPLYNGSP